ncbi:MAG TPA: LysR substrate-binding domain-containing protein [Streptosporangiaceae bacterium]|nr:LysR substrate-binding domain-containing protein [Streptosporangiaceae bacterium]
MELHQLEYFVAVAEEASFTRAAARVHVAQPGVSAQVRRLEAELGQQLLDRTGRSVRLTEVGQAVLPFARAALDAVEGARLTVDQLAGLVRGQVTVGMVSGCALPALAELLAGFHGRYPGVTITLTEDGSDRLTEQLRGGRLDLAVIGTADGPGPGLEAAVILDDELVAAVSPDDPLAARSGLTLAELAGQPLVSLPRGTGVRAALDAGCAAAGVAPRVVLEASALPMVARLAGLGLGVGILPASAAATTGPPAGPSPAAPAGPSPAALPPALHVLAVSPPLRSRLELAWNPSACGSPASRALIEYTRSFTADFGQGGT